MNKRLFIALPCYIPGLDNVIEDLKQCMKGESIKWIDPAQAHCTVQYIGNCDVVHIQGITAILEDAARITQNYVVRIEEIGFFRKSNRPRVIFAKWHGGGETETLYRKLNSILSGTCLCRYEPDYTPHITLGRINKILNIDLLHTITEKYRTKHIGSLTVSKIVLYESLTLSAGAVYRPVYTANLQQ